MENLDVKIKKSPVAVLSGEKLNTYVRMVIRLVKGGRLNKFFPDPSAFCKMMEFYLPEKNFGLYDNLEINLDTGLPSEKEITRLVSEREIAPKTLKEEPLKNLEEKAQSSPSEVNRRRLNRFLYHRDLLSAESLPLLDIGLKLKSLDTEKYVAYFNVEVTRFDISESLFAKYTMVAGQEDSHWNQQILLSGDSIKYTRNFRNLISRFTVDEAEFAFVLLNDVEKVSVEEVQRCRIGPLYFRGSRIPEGMEELFEKHPDAFILALPTDRATVNMSGDKNNDPLSVIFRDSLEPALKAMMEEKARLMNYHIYKDRKFVCTRSVLSDFSRFLKDRGARCVVYGV